MQRTILISIGWRSLAAALALSSATTAQASLQTIQLTKTIQAQQTDNLTVTEAAGILYLDGYIDAAADFDGAEVAIPGGATVGLTPSGDPSQPYMTFTDVLPDQAALDAAYPAGDYVYSFSNSVTFNNAIASLVHDLAYYPLVQPRFSNFESLADLDPNNPFQLLLDSGMPLDPNVNFQYASFGLYEFTNNNYVFEFGANLDFDNQVWIPADTMTAGRTYFASVVFQSTFSEYLDLNFPSSQIMLRQTYGYFTLPGVPEPANWAMLIAGFAMTGVAMRRRRAAVAA